MLFFIKGFKLPQDKKIKINTYQCLCVWRLGNILVLVLCRYLSWIKRYGTMKNGRFFFVLVYIGIYHTIANEPRHKKTEVFDQVQHNPGITVNGDR